MRIFEHGEKIAGASGKARFLCAFGWGFGGFPPLRRAVLRVLYAFNVLAVLVSPPPLPEDVEDGAAAESQALVGIADTAANRSKMSRQINTFPLHKTMNGKGMTFFIPCASSYPLSLSRKAHYLVVSIRAQEFAKLVLAHGMGSFL